MTSTIQPVPGRRNRILDVMRIVFALCVLLSHAAELTDGNSSREILTRLTGTSGEFTFGTFGVDGFFLLSGYLITRSWLQDPEFWNYIRKRLLRIVPGYIVAALISTVIVGLIAPGTSHFFAKLGTRYLISLMMLGSPATPAVLPGNANPIVNGAMWTISYEFRCYIVTALFGIMGILKRRRSLWLLSTMLLFSLVLMQVKLEWSQVMRGLFGTPSQLLRMCTVFFIGGCFYQFREKIQFLPIYAWLCIAALALIRIASPSRIEFAFMVFGAYLLFYIGSRRFSTIDNAQFPDISYGLYLYGWPVESLIIWHFRWSPWTTFFLATAICIPLGWMSWHFIERPFLTLKRHSTAPLPQI
jgi:peptidoglycan/LPS O-acetylase OafA/YrhL